MTEPLRVSLELLLLTRLSVAVMWLTFVVFHLVLAALSLFLLWWWQVQPTRLAEFLALVPASYEVQWLALLGCTGAGILFLYLRLWRRAYSKFATPYFFRGVTDGMLLTY